MNKRSIYTRLAEGARDFPGFVVLLSSTFQLKVGQNCLKYKICEIAAHNQKWQLL